MSGGRSTWLQEMGKKITLLRRTRTTVPPPLLERSFQKGFCAAWQHRPQPQIPIRRSQNLTGAGGPARSLPPVAPPSLLLQGCAALRRHVCIAAHYIQCRRAAPLPPVTPPPATAALRLHFHLFAAGPRSHPQCHVGRVARRRPVRSGRGGGPRHLLRGEYKAG